MNAYVAKYTKPIPLEELPYTPVELGDMLDSGEKEREIEVEGYGKGRLVISKQNKNKPFFYADEKNEAFNAQQMKKAERLFTIANAPAMFAPILAPFTARTQPAKVVLKDPVLTKGKKVTGTLPGSKGGQTLLQQRKTNKQTLAEFEATGFGKTKIAEDVFNMPTSRVQQIVKIAKRNNISYQKAEQYVNLKEQGITPTETLNPGTNAGLIEGDLPLNVIHARLMKGAKDKGAGDMTNVLQTGDVGIPGLVSTTRRKLTTPEFINKRFMDYGFTQKGPDGGWIFDEKVYNAKKPDGTYRLNDNQRREIAQIFQTDIDQTVPQSFTQEKNIKNLALNEELAAYNEKYGARAELHHDFPSALSAKFYFGLEYMSDEWRAMTALANRFGNYPGQPIIKDATNLVSLPSKIGSNHPNYNVVKGRFGNVPPHIHNIIHSQFFANETGMSGDKFFTPARVNKMDKSFEDRMEVFEEWNKIVARNRDLWNEGLKQLDVFFGSVPKENHDDLVRMLEEYLEKGMITMGKGKVRDRFGELVKTPDGKLAEVDYAQFSVQDIVSNALADFKADFKNDILGKNPRFKEALTEVSNFSQLNQSEIDDMANVLYKIKQYNGLRLVVGTRRAGEMVFGRGQNVKYYNELLELYMGLIDDALPNDTPTIVTLEQLKDTTFKDFKKPSLMKQLEMIFLYD